jgi:hypothetical protein
LALAAGFVLVVAGLAAVLAIGWRVLIFARLKVEN